MMATLPPISVMRKAYRTSDASFDGVFFLGVRTTGVFCRPSCGARKPGPANVEFFATPREALFAGYRPCKRCTPLAPAGSVPDWAARLLAEVERAPERRFTDADIRRLGVDPARARRFFQRSYGMTFQAYCRARRLGGALEQIRRGDRLDDVTLGHGFESHSGFRSAFTRLFGSAPGRSRERDCIQIAWIESPLGPLVAGATDTSLVLLEFTDRRMLEKQFASLRKLFKRPLVPGENRILKQMRRELSEYFTGTRHTFSLQLAFPGSQFQERVWKELQRIPYGSTLSYESLARRIGQPGAQRAVGHSNGLNRLAIVVPCHRVVNKNGKLGGYGGGLWRKQALLELERGERVYPAPAKEAEQSADAKHDDRRGARREAVHSTQRRKREYVHQTGTAVRTQ